MKKNFKKLIAAAISIGCICAGTILSVSAAEAEASPTAATGASRGGITGWLIPVIYILFFVAIGYFLIFRPNKKRKQEEEKLRNNLILGDRVVTIGGICGTIVNIKDDTITIESSLDRTLIEFKNWAIREVKKLETDDSANSKSEKTDKIEEK